MNEDIKKIKEKLKRKLENYELDKMLGQLSVDSIYHMFPTESKILLDYIEQLQNNWNELKKWCKETIETVECTDLSEDYLMGCEDILNKMQELEGNNDSKRDV